MWLTLGITIIERTEKLLCRLHIKLASLQSMGWLRSSQMGTNKRVELWHHDPSSQSPVEAHAQRRALFNTHLLVSKSNSKPDSCPHRFWSIQLTVCQKHHCSSRHEQYKWPLQTGLASPFAHQLIATSTNFSIIHQSLQPGVPPPPPFYFTTIHSVQHSLPLPGLWFAIIYWFI